MNVQRQRVLFLICPPSAGRQSCVMRVGSNAARQCQKVVRSLLKLATTASLNFISNSLFINILPSDAVW
jgi:hypothetical protein